jgi:hypothetical protein
MPSFKLTAKTDFGSGTKKVGRGSFIMMTSGSSTFGLSTSQITEAVKNQLGIDCIPAHKTYFNIERIG